MVVGHAVNHGFGMTLWSLTKLTYDAHELLRASTSVARD